MSLISQLAFVLNCAWYRLKSLGLYAVAAAVIRFLNRCHIYLYFLRSVCTPILSQLVCASDVGWYVLCCSPGWPHLLKQALRANAEKSECKQPLQNIASSLIKK